MCMLAKYSTPDSSSQCAELEFCSAGGNKAGMRSSAAADLL